MWEKLLAKITSVRSIATLMIIFTFCFITNKSLNLFIANISNPVIAPILEKIVMFLLGAFCNQVATMTTGYFQRSDRPMQDTAQSSDKTVTITPVPKPGEAPK